MVLRCASDQFIFSQLQLHPSLFYFMMLELDLLNISPVPDRSMLSFAKVYPEGAKLISPLRKR